MFDLKKAEMRLETEEFDRLTSVVFDLYDDALLNCDPEIELEPAEEAEYADDFEDPEDFHSLYDYVVDLFVFAAVLVHRLEQQVATLNQWHPLDRLTLVADWVMTV